MLKSTIKYGAVRAKVLAMYSRVMGNEEIARLCACSSLSDFAAVLRGFPGWGEELAKISRPTAESLKDAVKNVLVRDYEKLWSFCSLEDKELLSFMLRRGEAEAILHCLRRLRSGGPPMSGAAADMLREKSPLDMDALGSCADFSGLKEAAAKTIYASALAGLKPSGEKGLPDYREASLAVENAYYSGMFSQVGKRASGRNLTLLSELIGTQADWLNIVSILRLLKYYPSAASEGGALLIPVSRKLKPALAEKLLASGSPEAALAILGSTPLGKKLPQADPGRPERMFTRAMEDFCRKLIRLPEPTVCTAQAYLTVRELECGKLTRIIEAIDRGADPHGAL